MAQYRLFVLSEALPGQEDAYTKWSNEQHFPDIMRIPGVVGATRLQLTSAEPGAPGRFMAIFDCEKPAAEIMAEMRRRNGTAEMPAGPHHNRQTLQFLFGDVIGSW